MLARLKSIFTGIVAAAVAVAFLCFAMINREVVVLDLTPFPYTIEIRLFLLVAVLLLAGIFIGWVVASFECRRRYLIKKETEKRLAALENEVVALRARHQLPDQPAYARDGSLSAVKS